MRKVVIAGLALFLSSSALARDLTIHYIDEPYYKFGRTSAQIIHVGPMSDADRAQDARWEAFCKPVRHMDALGMIRLSYAHAGCEFGRIE